MSNTTGNLVHKKTGESINIGDEVTDFRGETWRVTGWREPQHPGSSGRIYVERGDSQMEYFPGVFDAEIKPA
jgi:hypothetical protein